MEIQALLREGSTLGFSLVLTAVCALSSSGLLQAQEPILKEGACPTGYRTSGQYCLPLSADAPHVLPKIGACPSGYRTSGRYCIALPGATRHVIIKYGHCPSGYRTSGNYCIKL